MPKSQDYDEKRDYIRSIKSGGCIYCGEKEIACLEMHHKDESTKKLNVGQFNRYSLCSLQAEIAKCVVVCANCHKKIHAK